jgi:hypothetical protein
LVEEKQMKFSFEDFVEEYTPPGNMFSPEWEWNLSLKKETHKKKNYANKQAKPDDFI